MAKSLKNSQTKRSSNSTSSLSYKERGIRGQFEERMQALMNEVQQDERIILFIDEVHELVGAGRPVMATWMPGIF